MLFYFSIASLPTFFVAVAKFFPHTRYIILFLVLIFLSLVLGFRGVSVGTDTEAYYRHLSVWINGSGNTFEYEPGLYYIYSVVDFLGVSSDLYFFIVAVLTLAAFLFGFLRFHDGRIPVYIFVSFVSTFYFYAFSGVRQIFAVSIVFFALSFLKSGERIRPFLFLLFFCFSVLIHNSVVVVLPLLALIFFWSEVKKSYVNVLFFLVSFFVFFLVSFFLMMYFYGNYLSGLSLSGGFGLTLIVKLMFYVISLFLVFKVGVREFSIFYFCFYSFGILASIPGYYLDDFYRLVYPFVIFEGLYYYRLMRVSKGALFVFISWFVLFLNLFICFMDFWGNGRKLLPYEVVFG